MNSWKSCFWPAPLGSRTTARQAPATCMAGFAQAVRHGRPALYRTMDRDHPQWTVKNTIANILTLATRLTRADVRRA